MGNAGGHNPAGGDGCWMAAKALVLSCKTQGRSNTLTSGLGLIWHHKCPFLAHSYVFNPQHLWITTTMGEKIWVSMWDFARQLALVLHTSHLHGDMMAWCTTGLWEKRVVFEVQTCKWGSGDWGSLYHGHDGWPGTGYWGHWLLMLCAGTYSSTKQVLPADEFHRQFFTLMHMKSEMPCKTATRGNPNSFGASMPALEKAS